MQATHPDAFALKNSGFNAFLYADIGAELSGSKLTILSMLARLGSDPWAEAARLATLPKVDVVEILAQSILRMPLVPSALCEARDIAARLVQLLPTTTRSPRPGDVASAASQAPRVPMAILYCVFVAAMALNAILISNAPATIATSVEQSVGAPPAKVPVAREIGN